MELELINLKKTYGTVQALKGINYKFTSGIYGILGSNGAGKSTMINLITDNISRDKINGGSILYSQDKEKKDILKLGKNFRKIVGYMPQQQGFYEDFSPMAFLKYMAEIKEVKKIKVSDKNGNTITKSVNQQIEELLDVVNLSNVAYKKIGGFSGCDNNKKPAKRVSCCCYASSRICIIVSLLTDFISSAYLLRLLRPELFPSLVYIFFKSA